MSIISENVFKHLSYQNLDSNIVIDLCTTIESQNDDLIDSVLSFVQTNHNYYTFLSHHHLNKALLRNPDAQLSDVSDRIYWDFTQSTMPKFPNPICIPF